MSSPTTPLLPRARRASAGRPAPTLDQAFDPRANALTPMRLGLAATVAGVHGAAIATGDQPAVGSADVGELAVDAFFVLSGFLVTRSFVRGTDVRRYAWHRALRIMPGFWVCLVLTAFVAAPVIAALEGQDVGMVLSGGHSAVDYVLDNATLLMRQFDVAGLPDRGFVPGVMDGALWTLVYEAFCYALLAGLGVIGLLRHRPGLVVLVAAALWALLLAAAAGAEVPGEERPVRFAFVFLLGALTYLFRHRVVLRPGLAVAAGATLAAALLLTPDYRLLAAPAFAYLLVHAMAALPVRYDGHDVSYGVYVYHWPVEQVLVSGGLAAASLPLFGLAAAALVFACATVSWLAVERPALRLKSVFSPAG